MSKDTPSFRGVTIPAEIFALQEKKILNATEVSLLALINALVKPEKGCFASNEYLAERIGRSEVQTRHIIRKLKGLELVSEVGFNGRRRYLETAWNRVKTTRQSGGKPPGRVVENHRSYIKNKDENKRITVRNGVTDGQGVGFGLIEIKPDNTTKEDTARAIQLLNAIKKKFGPSHLYSIKARPSVWALKLSRIRTLDGVPDDTIQRTMDWYVKHMGDDFIPEAYSGETFRKKFVSIQAAYERNRIDSAVVSPQAQAIFDRMGGLAWPKGSARTAPGAIQVSLEGYTAWTKRFRAFTGLLEEANSIPDLEKHRVKFLRLAQSILSKMPQPAHYIQGWFVDVHHRVANWEEWSGDFKPYLWKPDAKKFMNMGRRWAEQFYNNPAYWDRLMEVMRRLESERKI